MVLCKWSYISKHTVTLKVNYTDSETKEIQVTRYNVKTAASDKIKK